MERKKLDEVTTVRHAKRREDSDQLAESISRWLPNYSRFSFLFLTVVSFHLSADLRTPSPSSLCCLPSVKSQDCQWVVAH